ncbi:MAG: NAD(P)H-binding protein [Pseudomonadota bacterium]
MAHVMLFGASGTIGRAARTALNAAGHVVTAPARGADFRASVLAARPDVVMSCLASRTGAPADAEAVDHQLNAAILEAAIAAGVPHFILLSAICVQRPRLAFQHAKLAFEAKLRAAPIRATIVRPTAYFKSLSGQVDRLRAGKPFLVFGDGTLTACKPISDTDLGRYLALCVTDESLQGRILPIGGPGPALTPRAQGKLLFEALGLPPCFRQVPVALLSGIIGALRVAGFRDKAELARIGRYYATESMLVWTEAGYDADATPEFGSDTLAEHYARLAAGGVADDRHAPAIF